MTFPRRCSTARALACAIGVLACAGASGAGARRVQLQSPDEIVDLKAQVRHTTVIVLPPEERILDFVIGDVEYWALKGAANVAYLKPTGEEVRTNVALVTESGRIYAFRASEGEDPDLVVHVATGPEEGEERVGTPLEGPRFVAADEVAACEATALDALEEAGAARRDADRAAAEAIERFRAAYPRSLKFEYRLEPRARQDPFEVLAMWHDGTHTFLRSAAPESPALYESRDGKPSLVEYELTEDGLYVAQRVLRDGWLQVGKQRARWAWVPPEERP